MAKLDCRIPRKAAEVHPVREITLTGTADAQPFAGLLAEQELRIAQDHGAQDHGRAQLFLSATDARFHGVRFREFSISLMLDDRVAAARHENSALLMQAFNSVRFFAWIERTVFRTPYQHARIAVQTELPARVAVSRHGEQLVELRMADVADRRPIRSGKEDWAGRIHLPLSAGKRAPEDAKMFFARLSDSAEVYSAHSSDQVEFHAHPDFAILRQLCEANFAPQEWLIRTHGRHLKSKTVSRDWS